MCVIVQGSYWEIDPTPLKEDDDSLSSSGFPRKRKSNEKVCPPFSLYFCVLRVNVDTLYYVN